MKLTRRYWIAGGTALGSLAASSRLALAATAGISRAEEAIHQEPVFHGPARRIYEALLDAKQFDVVASLGEAIKAIARAGKPTEISHEPGGRFSLFGGYITGRQIELSPNRRIVQAWRVSSWLPGAYSIARFEFLEQGADTRIIFDHSGFPKGQAEHLADGWNANYWAPLEKFLARSA